MGYSIEQLFHECNMLHKVLEVELIDPIRVSGKLMTNVTLLEIICSDKESKEMMIRVSNNIQNYSGSYVMRISDKSGNPINYQTVEIDIEKIKEVWERD